MPKAVHLFAFLYPWFSIRSGQGANHRKWWLDWDHNR